jgi:Endonuclease/Exonuclease/phosphatase family
MTTFLFWNLMGNAVESWRQRSSTLRDHIARMASTFGVDVFMFVESGFETAELLIALNQGNGGVYCCPPSANERIQIITRFDPSALTEQYDSEDDRLTIRRLTTKTPTILLGVIHFQSQTYWTPAEQAAEAQAMRKNIDEEEDLAGHRRTILVGDLNMNPFDHGLVLARAFGAVMTRDQANAGERIVANRNYRLFYNPMWGYLGDRTPGPPGTYYYSASSPLTYFWNTFDQVLLRPDLMNTLTELQILDTDGQTSLLTKAGKPRKSEASDHLPILFRLDI